MKLFMHVALKMSCKEGGKVTLVASVELLFTVKSCSIILGTGAASAAVLAN